MANVLGDLARASGDALPEITEQTGSVRRELPGKTDSPPPPPSPQFIDEENEAQRGQAGQNWEGLDWASGS